jgi:hypothetical protein
LFEETPPSLPLSGEEPRAKMGLLVPPLIRGGLGRGYTAWNNPVSDKKGILKNTSSPKPINDTD